MSEELKPCPMCGRNIELHYVLRESDHPNDDDLLEARPSCHCPLSLKESAGYGEEEEQENARIRIIEYWNKLSRKLNRACTSEVINAWNAIQRPLRWTNELPKEPGWYWNMRQGYPEEMTISWYSETRLANLYTDGKDIWAGPIPQPEDEAGMRCIPQNPKPFPLGAKLPAGLRRK